MIYADYNSTTPCMAEVIELMAEVQASAFGNPSSRHTIQGRAARAHIDTARSQLAAAIGARDDEITFTSGATEACNMAIYGVAQRLLARKPGLLVAATEHEAVLEPVRDCGRAGGTVIELPVDANGQVNLPAYEDALKQQPCSLVCIMLANNETGVLHDIACLAERAHEAGALFLCDTTQALGKIPIQMDALGADFAVFSAHKCYGPKGVGALWKRRGLSIDPLLRGGGQEAGRRSGTENVAGIAGFGLAVQSSCANKHNMATLSQHLEKQLQAALPELRIHGKASPRIPGTSNIGLPGLRKGWLAQLSDVAASAGSSCASADGKQSHVLAAMGLNEKDAANAIRISLGHPTTMKNVDDIVQRLIAGANRLGART